MHWVMDPQLADPVSWSVDSLKPLTNISIWFSLLPHTLMLQTGCMIFSLA